MTDIEQITVPLLVNLQMLACAVGLTNLNLVVVAILNSDNLVIGSKIHPTKISL